MRIFVYSYMLIRLFPLPILNSDEKHKTHFDCENVIDF